jgi:propanol-preferring alcohol dehydrogenase
MTDTKPGDWVAISGIGGLGHMAVQYAKAMGRKVIAVDVDIAKLDLARRLGQNWPSMPLSRMRLLLFRRSAAERRACWSRRCRARPLNRPWHGAWWHRDAHRPAAGDFPLSIFNTVLGGIACAWLDRRHPARPDRGAGLRCHRQRATVQTARLEEINTIFARMEQGTIEGRVVLDLR